jgi:hypothetical protein
MRVIEEVIHMFFTGRKLAVTTLGAALTATILMLSTTALAQTGSNEATLVQSERAAQRAISDTPSYDRIAPAGQAVETTLAHNERAAQRAIADISNHRGSPDVARDSTAAKPTLRHNESAAARAIVDVPARAGVEAAVQTTTALSPANSTQHAASH